MWLVSTLRFARTLALLCPHVSSLTIIWGANASVKCKCVRLIIRVDTPLSFSSTLVGRSIVNGDVMSIIHVAGSYVVGISAHSV